MKFLSELLKNKLALIAFIFFIALLFLVILSIVGFGFDGNSFYSQDQNKILIPPSKDHILGTDQLGRDLLARLIYGSRLSLFVAIVTAIISFFIGVSLGTIAGLFEGKIDFIITRAIDIIYSLPDLLVLSIIGMIFSRSTTGILIAIGLISWMDVARLTRAEILKFKNHDFIVSARAIGLTNAQIVFKHILPNILKGLKMRQDSLSVLI